MKYPFPLLMALLATAIFSVNFPGNFSASAQETPAGEAGPSCPEGEGKILCLAEAGDVLAQAQLGMDAFNLGVKTNSAKDFKEALRWLEPAAKSNHVRAQVMLGFIYWEGWGTDQDTVRAYYWFNRAGSGGLKNAQDWAERIGSEMTPDEQKRARELLP